MGRNCKHNLLKCFSVMQTVQGYVAQWTAANEDAQFERHYFPQLM